MTNSTLGGSRIVRTGAKILLGVCMFGVPVAAFAQADPEAAPPVVQAPQAPGMAPMAPAPMGMAPGHMHHAKWMRDVMELDLSDDQRAQIKTAMEQFHAQHMTAKPTKSENMALHEQILAILTPEQRMTLKSEMKQQRMMMKRPSTTPDQMPTVAP